MIELFQTGLLRRVASILSVTTLLGCADFGGTGSPGATQTENIRKDLAPVVSAADHNTPLSALVQKGEVAKDGEQKSPVAWIYNGTGVLLKPPVTQGSSTGAANVSLNFEAADIRDIAKTILAEILKESYIVDPKAQGTISFRTTQPLPRDALLPTLETILRLNGIVMVKENGIFKIMAATGVKGSLSPQMARAAAGFSMQVVPLQFIGAREMAKILEGVAADPSLVKADELRNLLILAGTQNEIKHMLDTIEMFDVDWMSGMSAGLFILQSADVKSVEQEITKVFSEKSGGVNPLAGVIKLIPIERLNGFVIITPQPHYLEQAKVWLERLDRVGSTGGARLFVYHVQNGKAENLAELLNQMFGDQKSQTTPRSTPAPTVAPGLTGVTLGSQTASTGVATTGFGSTIQAQRTATTTATAPAGGSNLAIAGEGGGTTDQLRVVADPQNNALLILANSAGYEKIESALKKLDTAPRQVLIEVTIAEVTLKDELQYGIEWLFTNGARRSGKLDTGTAGLSALVPGFSYVITAVTGDTIKSVLNMLAADNKLNILSSPHIMVADNQTAKIQVGDSVPTAGPQTVAGAGVVISSVQYLDTGVILSVTPRINASGLVNLDIVQEVSTASWTTTSGLNSPVISKRSAKTAVAVQSGETMVLGGLMSEQNDNGSTGLPFLSSIPVLGGLFGTQSRKSTRTELVLMITPRVANNPNQAKALSDDLRKKMGQAKDLLDCGTSNFFGYTTRGGPWCLQPRRFDGSIDRMFEFDARGEAAYLKEESGRAK
jgi:general secretion pathway protein D